MKTIHTYCAIVILSAMLAGCGSEENPLIPPDNNPPVQPEPGSSIFWATLEFPVGDHPYDAASGDFNGDGNPDLVIVNRGSNDLSVLLGEGGRKFSAASFYPVGETPGSVDIADFNGDGNQDLACSNAGSGDITILLGSGSGAFSASGNYQAGDRPSSVCAFDPDGDGVIDLAVSLMHSDSMAVLGGNGDGTFRAPALFDAGGCTRNVIAGDFDEDGDQDLALTLPFPGVAPVTSGVVILAGDGEGGFAAGFALYFPGSGDILSSICSSDITGDGHPDILVAAEDRNYFRLLAGSGDGTFEDYDRISTSGEAVSVYSSDFNLDGYMDVASGSSEISVFIGSGGGALERPVNHGGGANRAITGGDFDSDGCPDLLSVKPESGFVSILFGQGNGRFNSGHSYMISGGDPMSAVMEDFDGDQYPDAVVANSWKDIFFFSGTGEGTLRVPSTCKLAMGACAAAGGDFNGDGYVDVALANDDADAVSVFPGWGNGTFGEPAVYDVGSSPRSICAADFNGDGLPDLATANHNSGSVSILLCSGDGTFSSADDLSPGAAYSITPGDFDEDSIADLAVRTSSGIQIWGGAGDGTFTLAADIECLGGRPPAAAADFNADGHLDLALINGDRMSLLLGSGDSSFSPGETYVIGEDLVSVTAADFNGDGFPDLATANYRWENISVLFGSGDGLFSAPVYLGASGQPVFVGSSDLDLDGAPDLVVGSTGGFDKIVVIRNLMEQPADQAFVPHD